MRPNDRFNMNKTTKRMLAAITDKDARDSFRQNMIQAQLQSEQKPVKEAKVTK